MKTKGLNYLEAVKALASKKCKEIESPYGICYVMVGGVVHRKDSGCGGVHATPDAFLGEWSLIGVTQKVVFSGVKWHKDNFIYPTACGSNGFEFYEMEDKPAMKMTLEWEE